MVRFVEVNEDEDITQAIILVNNKKVEISEYSTVEEILNAVGKDPKHHCLVTRNNSGGYEEVPKSGRRIKLNAGEKFVTDIVESA